MFFFLNSIGNHKENMWTHKIEIVEKKNQCPKSISHSGAFKFSGRNSIVQFLGRNSIVQSSGRNSIAHFSGRNSIAHFSGRNGIAHFSIKQSSSILLTSEQFSI